jgi:probable O-glycosylation ligase (exosortase A-associated)
MRGAPGGTPPGSPFSIPSLKGSWTVGTIAMILYLFVVHSYKVNAAQEVLFVGICGVMLFTRPLRVSPSMMWFAAFLAWTLITLPASLAPATSWDEWFNSFKVWMIMFLMYNAVRTQGQMRLIILAWLGLFALYPVRGTLFNFVSGNESFGRYAWNFTFANYNDLAALTLLPLAMAVDRLKSAEAKWIKLCAMAGLLVLPFIVLISQSRGGMLGLAAFFIFLIARSRQRIRMIIAMVVIGLGAVMFAPQAVWDRIVGMKALRSTETLNESDSSAQQRWAIMQVAAKIAASNPVVGVGLGAYKDAHEKVSQTRVEWDIATGRRDSHNTYLHVAAENGVIGLVLFLMIFVSPYNELRKASRASRKSNAPGDREMVARFEAYQAALVGLAVCAIFGSLGGLSFPYLFVTLAAAAVRMPGALYSPNGLQKSSPTVPSGQQPRPMTPRFRGGWRPPQTGHLLGP